MSFDGIRLDTSSFGASIRQLSALNGKTQAENLQRYARTTLSNRQGTGLLEITPPGGHGAFGSAAKRQGERAIERDLSAVFVGVKLKGTRSEQHPDVEGIHRRLFLGKRPGSKLRSDRGRQGYYVDIRKLRELRKKLLRRVGKLASGWLSAARRLGVAAPAWISRHGPERGSIRVVLSPPVYQIEMTCEAPANSPVGELERRVPYAIEYATNRAEREIAFLLAKDAARAGFQASS